MFSAGGVGPVGVVGNNPELDLRFTGPNNAAVIFDSANPPGIDFDLGTPNGGPPFAQAMVWLAYFGAPILTASTVVEAMLRMLAPQSWQLRRLKDHIVVVGDGDL